MNFANRLLTDLGYTVFVVGLLALVVAGLVITIISLIPGLVAALLMAAYIMTGDKQAYGY